MRKALLLSFVVYGMWSPGGYFAQTGYVSRPNDHTFKKINKQKKITIAVSNHYPPLGFQGKGVEFDMARSLAEFLDVRVKIVPHEIGDAIRSVEKNEVDISISGLSCSLERAKRIWFSEPYLSVHPAALVKKRLLPRKQFGEIFEDRSIKDLSDINRLSGVKLLVQKKSVYENLFPRLERLLFEGMSRGFQMLFNGQGNVLLHDSLYLRYRLKHEAKVRHDHTLLLERSYLEHLCIALPFGDIILKNQVDIWVKEKKRKNIFQKWVDHYFQ